MKSPKSPKRYICDFVDTPVYVFLCNQIFYKYLRAGCAGGMNNRITE